MYQGKHTHRRKRSASKKLTVLVSLLLILTVGMGATLAYLSTSSRDVVNVFEPGKVPPTINEPEWNNKVKENVTVSNNGNVPAYIRAAISVSWQKEIRDDAGNVIETQIAPYKPTDDDYTMTIAANTGWVESTDGFYYYTSPVAAEGGTTGVLINRAVQTKENADGYQLVIDVLAQTIQADGTVDGTANGKSVVAEVWSSGVSDIANDGKTLIIKTGN